MKIDLHKNFLKNFNKLPNKQKEQFYVRLNIFSEKPFDPILENHQLSGKFGEERSINVTGDIRAIFRQVGEDRVLFLKIGNHNNLYK